MAESEMVEKVARALSMVSDGTERCTHLYYPHARAAIEAIRTPTEAMVYDGYVRSAFAPECRVSSIQFDPKPVWTAMIDAALKP